MRAAIGRVSPDTLSTLRYLVAAVAPHLSWRHTGLGALQAYVREGDASELRVHVWHRDLVAPGIDVSGDVHDHRFDMHSTVLLGALVHTEYDFDPWPSTMTAVRGQDLYRIHDVVHARRALELVGSHHLPGERDEQVYVASRRVLSLETGCEYMFPTRAFHSTRADFAVTLVRKLNQVDHPPARVASVVGAELVHAFESPMPESLWRPILDDAIEQLRSS